MLAMACSKTLLWGFGQWEAPALPMQKQGKFPSVWHQTYPLVTTLASAQIYLCRETQRDDLQLTDRDQMQGMRWSRWLSLQIAVVACSITEPETLQQDLACEPCWKIAEAVKIKNLLFSKYFACDKIPCSLARCGGEFLVIFLGLALRQC